MNKSEENDSNHLVIKKSWDQALQPLKQIPMTLFLMYMTGNSISIIPIMMSSMLIIKPVKSLFAVQKSEYSPYLLQFCVLPRALCQFNVLNK